ncbi:VCBS repeat-containing protein [candidate division WOR-3 bacterium]|uniref:VCBS repeat-containing protein n=1 Tax=candidate division WOR-3 bacterium TaxID=2052148 RepID=A0A937XEI0_UNCW3|nr:VCBS repeat-containing protein [candidate division WOR-3 bacterium]
MCDWNSDGLLDLVTGERQGYFTVFQRKQDSTLTNAGRIQAHGTDIITDNNSWPWVCDWNLDGRKDLLVGQEGIYDPPNVYVYLNQGTDSLPVFGDSTPVLHNGAPFGDYRSVPLLIELDGDGRRDLVLGEWYSSVRLYRNIGTDTNPVFNTYVNLVQPDPDSFLNGNPPRVNFTDWDGDADLDMITCDYYGSVFLRENITPPGVEERYQPQASSHKLQATLVRGVLLLPASGVERQASSVLLDASGRRLMSLRPGPNDVSRLSPGVYFVEETRTQAQTQAIRKVMIAR